MKKKLFFPALLILFSAFLAAQEFNSVPLDHAAYDIIETGVIYGVCSLPSSVKPWSEQTVKELLWEMLNDPGQILTSREIETVGNILESFERKTGFDPYRGRYRREEYGSAFEAGYGWESVFSVEAPGAAFSSVNFAKIYLGGEWEDFSSWNLTVFGGFLRIGREERGGPDLPAYAVPTAFPHSRGKQWDGRVIPLKNPGVYSALPDDISLAGGFHAEINGVFWEDRLKLRLGRIRRDWGRQMGTSLFMNLRARPFTALEAFVSPLPWLDVSFLGGALERYREDGSMPAAGPFTNLLSLARLELNTWKYLSFAAGGGGILLKQTNGFFFTDMELRVPGMFTIWGALFVDRLDASSGNFLSRNGTAFAYQAGMKTVIRWLPLATFIIRYTKVEPYCYTFSYDENNGARMPSASAYVSGGESLGYYIPPNSDELFVGMESRLAPGLKAFIRFQMIRHGADYGEGAVPGSSLNDKKITNSDSAKKFYSDGVYKRDNVIKAGGEISVKIQKIPCTFFAETGLVNTVFRTNDDTETGNYDAYKSGNRFIFSAGFRLFK